MMQLHEKLKSALDLGRPYAFLSSLCREIQDLRETINDGANGKFSDCLPLYLDDAFIQRIETDCEEMLLGYCDDFVYRLANAQFIIVLFTKIDSLRNYDSGSLIGNSMVSMWEIELFHQRIYLIRQLYFQRRIASMIN